MLLHYILCSRSLLSLGMTSGLAGEGVGGSVGELEMAAWLQQVFLPFLLSLSLSFFPFYFLYHCQYLCLCSASLDFVVVGVPVFVFVLFPLPLSLSLSLMECINHADNHNQVWFKHVPTPNFLLADSFPVHTAQTTQKLLLQVSQKDSTVGMIVVSDVSWSTLHILDK